MGGSSDMNIILGQGNTVREVHQVNRDHLELNQQAVSQQAEKKKAREKKRVHPSDTGDRVTLTPDEEKRDQQQDPERENAKNHEAEDPEPPEGGIIDIKV
jgi:hypothetical protein